VQLQTALENKLYLFDMFGAIRAPDEIIDVP